MRLIEVMVTVEKGGVMRIPEKELETMGLREGDRVCLSYLAQEDDSLEIEAIVFLMERVIGKADGMPQAFCSSSGNFGVG